MDIRWVQFPLHPDTPAGGLALAELFRGRDIGPMQEMMQQRMRDAGLEYGNRSMTYNSRLAQELAKWAESLGTSIHDALFRAYFVNDINLAQIDLLTGIAADAGLDPDQARQALETRSFSTQVDADWQLARELGITGVPTIVAGNQALVGCQPYEVLESFVSQLQ